MHDQEPALHWLDCGGGPLILLSGEYVSAWAGYTRADAGGGAGGGADGGAPSGDSGPSGQTDYERARAVQDDLGLLVVDGGQGLIVSTEPMAIAWWALAPAAGILVCWMVGADEAAVQQSLARREEQTWAPSRITFVVGKHPLYLFDAIMPGSAATDYLAEYLLVGLDEGRYAVDMGRAQPDSQTELLLYRFRRQ